MDSLSFKALRKVLYIFLEDEKTSFTLNYFLIVVSSFFIFDSLFDVDGSVHNSAEGDVRILGRQGVDACFAFEVDVLPDEEGLCKVK